MFDTTSALRRQSARGIAQGIGLLAAWLCCALPALAQFQQAPTPLPLSAPPAASARPAEDYRIDAARHLYLRYFHHVHDGKLPPVLYAVVGTRLTVDRQGRLVGPVEITRPPADAQEVTPWVLAMIQAAGPFPPPPAGQSEIRYQDLWLVTREGRFQLHTLSEGQETGPEGAVGDEEEDGEEPDVQAR